MKQTVLFTLDKSEIYKEVTKYTAYEGAKVDETLYDRVRVKSGDKTALERWWCEACSLVTTCLIPYVTQISAAEIKDRPDEADNFTVTLGMPSNWNVSVKPALERSLAEIVTGYLLQQWYLLLNDEKQAKATGASQQTAIAKVGQLLYTRIRPTRPTFEEDIYGM